MKKMYILALIMLFLFYSCASSKKANTPSMYQGIAQKTFEGLKNAGKIHYQLMAEGRTTLIMDRADCGDTLNYINGTGTQFKVGTGILSVDTVALLVAFHKAGIELRQPTIFEIRHSYFDNVLYLLWFQKDIVGIIEFKVSNPSPEKIKGEWVESKEGDVWVTPLDPTGTALR